jgi:hypothetical protein
MEAVAPMIRRMAGSSGEPKLSVQMFTPLAVTMRGHAPPEAGGIFFMHPVNATSVSAAKATTIFLIFSLSSYGNKAR